MAAADSLLTPLSSCTAHGRSSWQQVERRRHASSAHGGQYGHVAGLQPSGEGTGVPRRPAGGCRRWSLAKSRWRPFSPPLKRYAVSRQASRDEARSMYVPYSKGYSHTLPAAVFFGTMA